ncbi:PhzF family phenazine biosynthesis protein [Nocardioides nanhaiensis]|uniref:PhzF family phenazine biosynthesis protein n=1 Tax=Nocardioides nanhaiensis TaxID=1476871 RepID=A0ABP8X121_9ACTN
MREFRQVDVFSDAALRGNPVAVVHGAEGLDDEQLAAFARWTNLSETTFLLTPTAQGAAGGADYRLRIFTPGGELPFAGHPTLGSAHAWLEAGGSPAAPGVVVQECGAGLVAVRHEAGSPLAFRAPPLLRSGAPTADELAAALRALRVGPDAVLETAWIDNGPGWLGVLLADPGAVLALEPDWSAFGELKIGVAGIQPDPGPDGPHVEVRAFCPQYGVPEDPVTGSLNAGLGLWLGGRRLPRRYMAAQGTVLQRAGRVHVSVEDADVWVGGATRTTIRGTLAL